jgi:hypothetical protein
LRQFPAEFDSFLSAKGRRLLAGRSDLAGALADPRRRFLAADGLLDSRQVEGARLLLERALLPHLSRIDRPIPPEATWEMRENYGELLPKTMRVSTATFERKRGRAWQAAQEIGLATMLGSQSFRAFAKAMAGRPLAKGWGMQALCYGPGDYAGPHNDHQPENPAAKQGYIDIHLSLPSPDVAQQFLVYAQTGHFTKIESVTKPGRITAYRLPLWHYTTPLVAKRGRDSSARRWVLLGTFLYADASSPPGNRAVGSKARE